MESWMGFASGGSGRDSACLDGRCKVGWRAGKMRGEHFMVVYYDCVVLCNFHTLPGI